MHTVNRKMERARTTTTDRYLVVCPLDMVQKSTLSSLFCCMWKLLCWYWYLFNPIFLIGTVQAVLVVLVWACRLITRGHTEPNAAENVAAKKGVATHFEDGQRHQASHISCRIESYTQSNYDTVVHINIQQIHQSIYTSQYFSFLFETLKKRPYSKTET